MFISGALNLARIFCGDGLLAKACYSEVAVPCRYDGVLSKLTLSYALAVKQRFTSVLQLPQSLILFHPTRHKSFPLGLGSLNFPRIVRYSFILTPKIISLTTAASCHLRSSFFIFIFHKAPCPLTAANIYGSRRHIVITYTPTYVIVVRHERREEVNESRPASIFTISDAERQAASDIHRTSVYGRSCYHPSAARRR